LTAPTFAKLFPDWDASVLRLELPAQLSACAGAASSVTPAVAATTAPVTHSFLIT
jgi:hypothetical protein